MAEDTKLDDFISRARKQFDADAAEEKDIRDEALMDLKFAAGDQWDAALKAKRIASGRPALTFNRCHTFVQQVSNEARQNKPQIKFVPAEDGDKDLAEIYEGLARHIQYDSDAQVAYETSVEYSAGAGFGYYGLITEYCDDESEDQDLKVRCFPDPFSVYGVLIPSIMGMEPDHAFVTTYLTKEEYEMLYPDSEASSLDWDTSHDAYGNWISEGKIRIAEYWEVEKTEAKNKSGRKYFKKTVKFYKINGGEKLEETEWHGDCIPIIPVLGKQLIVGGKPYLFSVIRFQRDPQQLINFYKTRIAETIGTAPIQPYMVAKGSIPADARNKWMTMNSTMAPFLEYEPMDVNGKVIPPPQRQTFEPPIGSLSEAAAQEIDDMKATAGIYDASMGSESNEKSGIAIQRRQQQSNVTNMHFMDNLERGFKKGGVMIAELLDVVYKDSKRRIRILGEDEAPKIVAINQKQKDGKEYKFGAAKFDVIVTMGRSFSTKRMESFDMMSSIIQASPDILPMVGDIFFRNSDLAGADQLADRFKAMLPPQIQQAEQQNGQSNIPPEVQAQMQQMQAQMQQMGAELQDAQNPLKVEQLRQQGQSEKLQHEKEMAVAKFQHELELKRMDVDLQAKLALAKHDSDEEKAIHDAESKAALEIYKTEAMLKSKQIDRDAAEQAAEAKEDKETAQAME
jgi:hypothetical protein